MAMARLPVGSAVGVASPSSPRVASMTASASSTDSCCELAGGWGTSSTAPDGPMAAAEWGRVRAICWRAGPGGGETGVAEGGRAVAGCAAVNSSRCSVVWATGLVSTQPEHRKAVPRRGQRQGTRCQAQCTLPSQNVSVTTESHINTSITVCTKVTVAG